MDSVCIFSSWSGSESGLRATIWLCAFANFINSADRVIMPISITGLAEEYGYDLIQQGWIHSAFPAGYISSQVKSFTVVESFFHIMSLDIVSFIVVETK